MFCKKCGNPLPENATVCESCNTRAKDAVFCHKCATELPANSIVCTSCNTKSRAHKSLKHWIPVGLAPLAFIFYMFGGYYYFDSVRGIYIDDMPYTTVLDYLALVVAIIGLIIASVVIPKTRIVLKVISIILCGLMLWLSVDWILYALF